MDTLEGDLGFKPCFWLAIPWPKGLLLKETGGCIIYSRGKGCWMTEEVTNFISVSQHREETPFQVFQRSDSKYPKKRSSMWVFTEFKFPEVINLVFLIFTIFLVPTTVPGTEWAFNSHLPHRAQHSTEKGRLAKSNLWSFKWLLPLLHYPTIRASLAH